MGYSRRGAYESGSTSRADRLAAARKALTRAESRAGLHDQAARRITRVLADAERGAPIAGATALAASASLAQAGEPTPESLLSVGADAAGVVTLTGSTGALLALAALQQGRSDWCGVVGCEGLGWCAAAEAGLDLSRVLAVPAADLPPNLLTAALGALLDGVAVLLVSAAAASRLLAGDRRTLLARARERGCLILTPFAWEGARFLEAEPDDYDTGLPAGLTARQPSPPASREPPHTGVLVPLHNHLHNHLHDHLQDPQPQEMRGGYLRQLAWNLHDRRRPGRARLVLDDTGVQLAPVPARPQAPVPVAPAVRPRLVVVDPVTPQDPREEEAWTLPESRARHG
ncbi:hypothetical protein [Actinomyces sp. 565]|uniref:hypothetical protein n=1 Tax=Actinomyces sp. 565 TaxID=2057794 RepID=UPI0013A6D01D|nr:hypothetical protein [Actinomyces sp. 565]NDR54020.1 hypothetical protein [Actinomyces sp. 565]